MSRIFSRSLPASNAFRRCRAASLLAVTWLLASCGTPVVPANVILNDAHSDGDSIAFSRDSARLASGGMEGRIRLWRMPDGAAQGQWQAHDGPVQGLAFLEKDRVLLSTGHDATIAKWDISGRLRVRRETPAPITDIALDESGNVLITGHTDGAVRSWRLSDLAPRQEWRIHSGAVDAVAYHARTRRFASSGAQVFIWRTDEKPRQLPTPPTEARELAFSPDGQWLTGGGWFNLFQWHVADGALAVLPTEHNGIIKSIDYSADGKTLATISRLTDSSVYFLDPHTGAVQRRFQRHDLCGARIRLSPNGQFLASTSDDASVRIWDLAHPLPLQTKFDDRQKVSP